MEREKIFNSLNDDWDVLIIGGGITGAGIFYMASKLGLKTLLIEQRDYSWGTSSRSAKLVHGGLRYLAQGQILTTWHSVRERQYLLKKYGDIIHQLRFIIPSYKNSFAPYVTEFGLNVYDLMACRPDYLKHNKYNFSMRVPLLSQKNIKGGLSFSDATTDDSRLVLRVITEGRLYGGTAINYTKMQELMNDQKGRVRGVIVEDQLTGSTYEVFSKVTINATGIFSDSIRSQLNKKPKLRKLRGSHIIFPHWRFPIYQGISINHPIDKRPLYVIPWNGVTLFGTTDIEHHEDLQVEPKISNEESSYLFRALHEYFPTLHLSKKDAISTFAGVRPVIDTGKENPSKESRDYAVWDDNGLITVTGGKLTTFRLLARDTLKKTRKYLQVPHQNDYNKNTTASSELQSLLMDHEQFKISKQELSNNLHASSIISHQFINDTNISWEELIYLAKVEQVVHLDDLLLRRSRLGLILKDGGIHLFDQLEKIIAPVLGYNKQTFEEERNRYINIWNQYYSPDLL